MIHVKWRKKQCNLDLSWLTNLRRFLAKLLESWPILSAWKLLVTTTPWKFLIGAIAATLDSLAPSCVILWCCFTWSGLGCLCVCATGVEVDLQCTDVASLFYVLCFFVFYICMLVVWKHPVFTQHVKIARWITCHMSHVNVSYISFPRKKHIL